MFTGRLHVAIKGPEHRCWRTCRARLRFWEFLGPLTLTVNV